MDEKKKKILDYLEKEKLMVVSTINKKEKPESAVVGFSETEDLEIIFGTFNNTRKYNNLKNNKEVSLVIGWDLNNKITIQYEGTASELKGEELETLRKLHVIKNPESEEWVYHRDEVFFKIKPKWIRYSNLSKGEIFELNLD